MTEISSFSLPNKAAGPGFEHTAGFPAVIFTLPCNSVVLIHFFRIGMILKEVRDHATSCPAYERQMALSDGPLQNIPARQHHFALAPEKLVGYFSELEASAIPQCHPKAPAGLPTTTRATVL